MMHVDRLRRRRLCGGLVLAVAGGVSTPLVLHAASATPQRLVTLGGSVTEIVYALGMGHKIVADDASSLYPEAARQLPKVGYYRAVPLEGVLSVEPDLVLASENAGPPAVLDRLQSLNVRIERVSDQPSLDSLYQRIGQIADLLGVRERGDALVASINTSLAAMGTFPQGQALSAVVLVNRTGGYQVAGSGTAANAILKLAGLNNAMISQSGYKPLSVEALASLAPDMIVLTSASAEALGGIDAFQQHPAVQLTPAAQQGRVVVLDDLLILGLGPRVVQAIQALRQQAHH